MKTPAARRDELWDGEMRAVVVDDVPVLLTHVEGAVCAYVDRCPHLGTRLSEGRLDGRELTCRAHHWRFDIVSGDGINPASARLHKLPVRIVGDDVFVDVDSEQASASGVGPVLLRTSVGEAIAAAILAANPGATTASRGAYLRILAPTPCVVARAQVEEVLGAPFSLPCDLERVMPSCCGLLSMSEETARWD